MMRGSSPQAIRAAEMLAGMPESTGTGGRITSEKTRVLIATADTVLCFALRPLLEAEGYAVSCVGADADAALGRIASFGPRLILVDVAEPGGWEQDILGQLRADQAYALVAVVILAAATNPRLVTRQALGSGADDVIFKPCDRDLLVTRLVTALRAKEALAQALARASRAEAGVQALLTSLEGALLVVDPDGRVLEAYGDVATLLGSTLGDPRGRALADLLAPDSVALARQAQSQQVTDGPYQGLVTLVRPDGSRVDARARCTVAETPAGRRAYISLSPWQPAGA